MFLFCCYLVKKKLSMDIKLDLFYDDNKRLYPSFSNAYPITYSIFIASFLLIENMKNEISKFKKQMPQEKRLS